MTTLNKRKKVTSNHNHNVKVKKRSLTLIEIVVVLIIMSLGASVVCINISNAIADNRFKEAKRIISEKLLQASKISKLTSSQVDLFFLNKDNRLFVYMDGENIPNEILKKKLKMKDEILGLKSIEYHSFSTDEAELVVSISKEMLANFENLYLRLNASPSKAYDLHFKDIFEYNNKDLNFSHDLFPKDILQEEEKTSISSR